MTAPIDGEWASELTKSGVEAQELAERWELLECLIGAQEQLCTRTEDLRDALWLGLEGRNGSALEVAARAGFEQALAEFRDVARTAQRYVPGV